jgi:hypothetical protein
LSTADLDFVALTVTESKREDIKSLAPRNRQGGRRIEPTAQQHYGSAVSLNLSFRHHFNAKAQSAP